MSPLTTTVSTTDWLLAKERMQIEFVPEQPSALMPPESIRGCYSCPVDELTVSTEIEESWEAAKRRVLRDRGELWKELAKL